MGRRPCCDKEGVKKGAWTPEEDKILVDYITKHGHGTWRSLPKHAGISCIYLDWRFFTLYFESTLTASDTSTHGGFLFPRRAAEKVFPPLDFSQQPPARVDCKRST